jgi:hypothetical protein
MTLFLKRSTKQLEARERGEILQWPIYATIFGTIIFGMLTILALGLEFRSQYFQTYLLLCVCGWAAGWFTAMLITPFTEAEASVAGKIFGFIATFASGYLLGVISPFVQTVTKDSEAQALTFKGLLFFVASFLTTLLISVIVRRYYEGDKLVEDKKAQDIVKGGDSQGQG